MEKFFKLKENGTSVRTEMIAGLTTFMTMAYILAVNPGMLSDTGMDAAKVFTATALSAGIATLVMALLANLPFALAPGMGLNAFFAFSVCLGMGKSFEFALTAVFLEGIIFLILSVFNVREAIVNSIPLGLKKAVSVGIGLFIAFIGLQNVGVVTSNPATLVALGPAKTVEVLDASGNVVDMVASPEAISILILFLIGLLITGVLLALKVKGALFLSIIATTIIGIPMGVTPMPSGVIDLPASPYFLNFEWDQIFTWEMLYILLTFLFVDIFDTVGTLVGVATKADMLTEKGEVPRVGKALFADAVGTTVGAIFGTSTVTTYVESASGVADGGRTGLTALTTGVLFFIALFFWPILSIIPAAATAPILVMVGLFMLSPVKEIDLEDMTEAIPAFIAIIAMPLTYSIANGIAFGIISYVLLHMFTLKFKKVPVVTYILAVLFVLKFIFIGS